MFCAFLCGSQCSAFLCICVKMSSSRIDVTNFGETCRLCLSQGSEMTSIFDDNSDVESVNLSSKINSTVAVEVSPNDGLPGQICQQCYQRVDAWHTFKLMCHNTDLALHHYIRVLEGNDCEDAVDLDSNAQILYHNKRKEDEDTYPCNFTENPSEESLCWMTDKYGCEDLSSEEGDGGTQFVEMDSNNHESSLTCNLCLKTFKRSHYLKRHMKQHENCLVDGGQTLVHKCEICPMRFREITQLRGHMKCHKEANPLQCPICEKHFMKRHKLNAHLASHTSQCEFCKAKFSREQTLRAHLERNAVHNAAPCFVCGLQFETSCQVKAHVKLHKESRGNLTCHLCRKTSVSITSFRIHMRKHRYGKREDCHTCGKKFYNVTELKKHELTHDGAKDFICQYCGTAFITKCQLDRHLKYHNSKQHMCEECGEVFYELSHLTVHKRHHSGEKPFKCITCFKAFVSSSALSKHRKVHDKKNVDELLVDDLILDESEASGDSSE